MSISSGFGQHDRREIAPDCLGGRQAEDLFGSVVPAHDAALEIEADDGVAREPDDRGQSCLRRVGRLPMRHVEVNPKDPDRAVPVESNSSALGDPANRRARPARPDTKLDIPLRLMLPEGVIESRVHPLPIFGMDAGGVVDRRARETDCTVNAPKLVHFRRPSFRAGDEVAFPQRAL